MFRYININNGQSANFLFNNLVKSDRYAAMAKNSFGTSKVILYKVADLENEAIPKEELQACNSIDWESKDKECTHINYLCINNGWVLLLGFVGKFEIWSEDGTKNYFSGNLLDFGKYDQVNIELMNSAVTSSCIGFSETNNLEEGVFIMNHTI